MHQLNISLNFETLCNNIMRPTDMIYYQNVNEKVSSECFEKHSIKFLELIDFGSRRNYNNYENNGIDLHWLRGTDILRV